MFINEPVLKGSTSKKKPKTMARNINEYEFSPSIKSKAPNSPSLYSKATGSLEKSRANSLTSATLENDKEKKYLEDEVEFEDNLFMDLNKLLERWERSLKILNSDLKVYQNVEESDTEIRAFVHCMNLLESEFQQAENAHESVNKVMTKKVLQVDDYKLRIVKEIDETNAEKMELGRENERLEGELHKKEKEQHNRKSVNDKIREEKLKIDKIKSSLIECKEKSLEQKNEFVEIQSEEFRLESEIVETEKLEAQYESETILLQKYNELKKIKQKVIESKEAAHEEVRPHLERKIEKMAKIRSSIESIDEALEVCCIKIEDQNIIVEALKEKSYHEQVYQSEEGDLYQRYKKRYNEIYFGEKKEGEEGKEDEWKDYQKYLKFLISKNKNYHSRVYTEGFGEELRSEGENERQNFSSNIMRRKKEYSKPETRDNFYSGNNRVSENPEKHGYMGVSSKKEVTKLPKILKNGNKDSEDDYLRRIAKQEIMKVHNSNIKNLNNHRSINKDSDFELESIKSNDSQVSGEIIEVEFHKK